MANGNNAYKRYVRKTRAKGGTAVLTRYAYNRVRSPQFRSMQIAKAPWLKRIVSRMRGF